MSALLPPMPCASTTVACGSAAANHQPATRSLSDDRIVTRSAVEAIGRRRRAALAPLRLAGGEVRQPAAAADGGGRDHGGDQRWPHVDIVNIDVDIVNTVVEVLQPRPRCRSGRRAPRIITATCAAR